jgi:hypothetical protein
MGHDKKAPQPDLTIVGGQPRPNRRIPGGENTEIPVGFEMLLYRAAQEPDFKQRLLADRTAAVRESGIPLRPSEQATLDVISNAVLETMIDRLVPDNPRRRPFMKNVAAAVTSLAASTAAVGALATCGDDAEPEGGHTTTTTTTTDSTTTTSTTTTSTTTTTTTTYPDGGYGGAGIGPEGGYGGWGGEGGYGGSGGAGGAGG